MLHLLLFFLCGLHSRPQLSDERHSLVHRALVLVGHGLALGELHQVCRGEHVAQQPALCLPPAILHLRYGLFAGHLCRADASAFLYELAHSVGEACVVFFHAAALPEPLLPQRLQRLQGAFLGSARVCGLALGQRLLHLLAVRQQPPQAESQRCHAQAQQHPAEHLPESVRHALYRRYVAQLGGGAVYLHVVDHQQQRVVVAEAYVVFAGLEACDDGGLRARRAVERLPQSHYAILAQHVRRRVVQGVAYGERRLVAEGYSVGLQGRHSLAVSHACQAHKPHCYYCYCLLH